MWDRATVRSKAVVLFSNVGHARLSATLRVYRPRRRGTGLKLEADLQKYLDQAAKSLFLKFWQVRRIPGD